MVKRIRCDDSCARGSRLLTRDCCGHGLRYYATSRSPVGRDSGLPTSPASYATSRSPVERGSCTPDLQATLLASRLLNEFVVDLTCELRY